MPDPIIPIEALEGLMRKAFLDNAVAPGLFWDALLKCNLYVPLSKKVNKEELEGGSKTQMDEIPLLLGVDSQGKHVLWLFTSPHVMVEYIEQDLPYLGMLTPNLLSNLKDSEHELVLIGPDGLTLGLNKGLVASLAEGKVPDPPKEEVRHIAKDTEVYVGKPPEKPVALEERLTLLFKDLTEVTEACFIQIADDTGSRLLLGVKLTEESRQSLQKVAEAVAAAAQGILEKGKTMDITLMNGSLKAAFAKWGTSFFTR
jgi:hypothetical protein